jgi:hypothetical protein
MDAGIFSVSAVGEEAGTLRIIDCEPIVCEPRKPDGTDPSHITDGKVRKIP